MVDDRRQEGSVALAAGPIAALIVAGLLASFRDEVGTTNVALILAMIVVVAALAGRLAGIATAITAAVAFNFFHTQPYRSLRIHGARDIVTVILLAALGILISEVGAWRRRAQMTSARRLHGAQALEATAELLAKGAPSDEVWNAIHGALVDELHLDDCRYEPGEATSLPLLPRSGSLVAPSMRITREGFALPDGGAAIAVAADGHTLGHIVLIPRAYSGSPLDARRLAVALADQYAIALREASLNHK